MKRELLACALAVCVVEGLIILLSLDDYPSRALQRYPDLVWRYLIIFPILLFVALAAVRLKWRSMGVFASIGAGTAAGLILGVLAAILSQLADPVYGEQLRNSFERFGYLEILAVQVFVSGAVTLAWLHGALAGLLAALFQGSTGDSRVRAGGRQKE